MSAIVVRGLTKKFRKNLVLDHLDLEIYEGEIFSLMGLKDSGKTTFARVLFQFLKASSGSIHIFDMDGVKDSKTVKEFSSYVPEDVWIYENLKPMSIFKKTLAFHDLKNMDDVHFLMDLFEVDNKEKFMEMSDSKRKRVSIINALITKPKLLVIDEPSKYLSVSMVEKLFSHLNHLKDTEGLSVLVLTNSLSLGQRYSDRVAYLSEGRVVDLEYVKDKDTNDKVIRIYDDVISLEAFESIGAKLLKEDQGESIFFYDGYLPTLTTVLYQERIKNFTLEDAVLENKIHSYSSKTHDIPQNQKNNRSSLDNEIDVGKVQTIEDTTNTIVLPNNDTNKYTIDSAELSDNIKIIEEDSISLENNNMEDTILVKPEEKKPIAEESFDTEQVKEFPQTQTQYFENEEMDKNNFKASLKEKKQENRHKITPLSNNIEKTTESGGYETSWLGDSGLDENKRG